MTGQVAGGGSGIDYVLPLKWSDDSGLAELTSYLRWLVNRARVIVVDGSGQMLYAAHARVWSQLPILHVPPDDLGFLYGKVDGVHTGVRLATSDHVVIADDDVRYDDASLTGVIQLLDSADLVGPQNYFDPLPWHAAWDTARSLLNRAVGADYPGTFAVRRSTFISMGGYNGDVMFENLELMRTVEAAGGRVVRPRHIYVRRLPPSTRLFLTQRIRQAYDDLAQLPRLAFALALLPASVRALRRSGPRPLAAGAAVAVAAAEVGRRRAGGRAVYPARTSLFAPLWLTERALCSWLALWQWRGGGVRYRGQRLPTAAHSRRALLAAQRARALVGPGSPESVDPVAPVAERLERGPSATTQRERRPAGIDLVAVRVEEPAAAPDDQRTVSVQRDRGPAIRR